MTSTRRPTLKIWTFGFLGGVLVGLLLGWLLDAGDRAGDAALGPSQELASMARTNAPLLEGRGPTTRSDAASIREARPETSNDAPAAWQERPPPLSTFVQVVLGGSTDNAAHSGTAYVLPAGESASRDVDDVPYADEDDAFLIPIVAPGSYDVGYVVMERRVLERDVVVPAGKTTVVHLTVPRQTWLELEWPAGRPPAGQRTTVIARTTAPGQSRRPGRHGPFEWTAVAQIDASLPRQVHRIPVPSDTPVAVSVSLREPAGGTNWRRSTTHKVTVAPETARAGDVLKLVPHPLANVILQPIPQPAPRGIVTVQVKLALEQDGETRQFTQWVQLRGDPSKGGPYPIILRGEPGPARLSWSGPGLSAGAVEDLHLVAGEAQERDLPLIPVQSWPDVRRSIKAARPRKKERVEQPLRRIRLDGLREASLNEDGPTVFERRPDGETGITEWDRDVTEGTVEMEEATAVAAFDGPWRASRFVPLRSSGTTSLRLLPAGVLVLVPERMPPRRAGGLYLRRADGDPIPFYFLDAGDEINAGPSSSAVQLDVGPGMAIGPFPAGTVHFEVFVGKARRGEIRATVRAGLTTPLVVRW